MSLSLSVFSRVDDDDDDVSEDDTEFGRWRDGIDDDDEEDATGEKKVHRAQSASKEKEEEDGEEEGERASSCFVVFVVVRTREEEEEGGTNTRTSRRIRTNSKRKGLRLTTTRVGPFFKITARKIDAMGRFEEGYAVTTCRDSHARQFTPFPFNILHLDTMRVYNSE